jgi:hypothetical protein
MLGLEARASRARALATPIVAAAEPVDRACWDWYAESCPCGLPPGACRAHPRARQSQRPPAGDWRVWGYVAGRGAGKTRAGACWVQHRAQAGVMKLGCREQRGRPDALVQSSTLISHSIMSPARR